MQVIERFVWYSSCDSTLSARVHVPTLVATMVYDVPTGWLVDASVV